MAHFRAALQRVPPSVSAKDRRLYDALRSQLASSRGHLNAAKVDAEAQQVRSRE